MTYEEVIDYLFHQFPQYQKIGGKAFKPGLDNVHQLCEYLDHPEAQLKFIHVAGTNGKGSTCSMLASVLKEAGHNVGLFTSPHLVDFSERIRINGVPIDQDAVVKFVVDHKSHFDASGASFFEWSLALALHHFKQEKVDIVILETGLGGRLDATNIVTPILSVITNIGIDHTQYLGNTITEIAREKAGIIKPGIPVVTTLTNDVDALEVIHEVADQQDAVVYMAGMDENYTSDLTGSYQRINKGVVLKTLEALEELGFECAEEHITKGLLNVRQNAGLRGRWEVLSNSPKTIADIGHNYDGVKELMQQLEVEDYNHLHIIWGMVADKEIERIVELLPTDATYYLSSPQIPRALGEEELCSHFEERLKFKYYPTIHEAYETALKYSKSEDLIFVGGSTFVVAEIISDFFLEKPL